MSLTPRTCRAALRHATARRAFSTSNTWQRQHLPEFHPSSTPALTELLATASKRMFAPAHLNQAQQDLVYKTKLQGRLEADPLTMTIGEQEIKLEHIDRHRDVPGRWKVFRSAIGEASSREDWENVGKLLEAFHGAGMTVKPQWQEKFVRNAFDAGYGYVVLLALRRVEKSGLSLADVGVAERVMWGIHENAQMGEWAEEPTAKALKYAEQVVDLMEVEAHCGRHAVVLGDTRTQPFVIALPLEMAAVLALKHHNGKDVDGKVKLYATRLVSNLKEYGTPDRISAAITNETPHESAAASTARARALGAANKKIVRMLPVWHALTLARKVLQLEMPRVEDAEKIADALEAKIAAEVKTVRANLPSTLESPEEYWALAAWRGCVR